MAGGGGVVGVAGGEPGFADELIPTVEVGGLLGADDADAGWTIAGAPFPVTDDIRRRGWGGERWSCWRSSRRRRRAGRQREARAREHPAALVEQQQRTKPLLS